MYFIYFHKNNECYSSWNYVSIVACISDYGISWNDHQKSARYWKKSSLHYLTEFVIILWKVKSRHVATTNIWGIGATYFFNSHLVRKYPVPDDFNVRDERRGNAMTWRQSPMTLLFSELLWSLAWRMTQIYELERVQKRKRPWASRDAWRQFQN